MQNLPFKLLYLLTLVVFLRPQELFPSMPELPLGDIFALGALAAQFVPNTRSLELILRERETKILIGILGCILLTLPFGLWPGGSFEALKSIFIPAFLTYFLIVGIVNSPEKISKIIWIVVICVTLYAALGLIDYTQGMNLIHGRLKGRAEGIYGNPNAFAINLCLTLPLIFPLIKTTRNGFKKLVLYGASAVNLGAIVFTYSRTGMLALIMVLFGYIGTSRKKFRKLFCLLAISLIMCLTIVPSRFVDRAISIVDGSKDEVGSREARINILKTGIKTFLERPILGVGYDNFHVAEGASHGGIGKWNKAHNGFLAIAVELGALGLLLYLFLLFSIHVNFKMINRIIVMNNISSDLVHICQALQIILWTFLVAVFFGASSFSWIFIYLLGFSVAIRKWLADNDTSSLFRAKTNA